MSNAKYKGINKVNLLSASILMGYMDPRWMTFKQAQDKGYRIKKGEKGQSVEFWKLDAIEKPREESNISEATSVNETSSKKASDDSPNFYSFAKYSTVFNASQIEGIPPLANDRPKPDFVWDKSDVAERILRNSGAVITHRDSGKAFYRMDKDEITLPNKGQFYESEGYYATALHELGHWTGHEKRLNRNLKNKFGNRGYAREELRAEIASVFLCLETGIALSEKHVEQHAAYTASWLKSLKEDKHEFARAARDADQIANYIMGFNLEKVIEQEPPKPAVHEILEAVNLGNNIEKRDLEQLREAIVVNRPEENDPLRKSARSIMLRFHDKPDDQPIDQRTALRMAEILRESSEPNAQRIKRVHHISR